MFTLRPRILFCTFLALGLTACGNSKFEASKSSGERTFVHYSNRNEAEPLDSYRIQLRGQNFEPVRRNDQGFQGLRPTQLSQSIQSAILEDNTLKIQIAGTQIKFQVDYEDHLKFNELDESGDYSIKGSCLDYSCSRASFQIEQMSTNEVAELQYVRTYEYLTSDSELQNIETTRRLIQEAIRFRFPIARHSLRVNNSRDLDKLVIERPKVDYSDESYEERVLEKQNNVIVVSPGHTENPTPSPQHVKPQPAEDRIELDAGGIITVRVKKEPDTQNQSDEKDKVDSQTQLRLTPNPYEVYDLMLPDQFYPQGYEVDATNPFQFQNHLAFTPIQEQSEFEPAQRIAAIAKAFVEQNIEVYLNACNHYVRAVMALAGYTDGGVEGSNEFDIIFRRNSQGLRNWRKVNYNSPNDSNKKQLQKDLNTLLEHHGIIYQVDRSRLIRSDGSVKHGHTAIVVKEGTDIVIYESSLGQFGPRRSVIDDPKKLISTNRPVVNLHHYPGVLNSTSAN